MIIKRDIFPAVVTFNTGTQLTKVRVVQTHDSIIIAQDTARGPLVIFNSKFQGTPTWNGTQGAVVFSDSQKLEYKKDTACGCGSRLASWNPYRNIVNSSQDPVA